MYGYIDMTMLKANTLKPQTTELLPLILEANIYYYPIGDKLCRVNCPYGVIYSVILREREQSSNDKY